MKAQKPSELELQVLSVLWDAGPSTVREVRKALPDGKTRAYTTVLSVLQVMEKKGLVTHKPRGRAHVYHATVTRGEALHPMLRGLVDNVFGGSASAAVQHLLQGSDVGEADLSEIRELLDRLERDGGEG